MGDFTCVLNIYFSHLFSHIYFILTNFKERRIVYFQTVYKKYVCGFLLFITPISFGIEEWFEKKTSVVQEIFQTYLTIFLQNINTNNNTMLEHINHFQWQFNDVDF